MTSLTRTMNALARGCGGAALTEFALAAPLLMTAGLWGVETANQAIVQMRVNQIAVLVADNAARIGENSLLGEAKIYESDINDVLYGANIQGGEAFAFYERGRVILSSLEVVPESNGNGALNSSENSMHNRGPDNQQYIHWQRCMGELHHLSSYGNEGDGLDGSLVGMGPPGEEIIAFEGEAVMFVEVAYVYKPLIASAFTNVGTITATAAFNVRENRDLSQIYQRDAGAPDPQATCDKFQGLSDYYS
jgi:hypothetical protein